MTTIPLDRFAQVAAAPLAYGAAHKKRTGQKVVGSFPMNFPGELAHAAGTLPMVLQEHDEPITAGHGLLYPFYCGFTRSMVDQAAKGHFDGIDAILFGDHCVQLLGAADAVRMKLPGKQVGFYQLISSMCDPWTHGRARESFLALKGELETLVGHAVGDAPLSNSIRIFNRNRRLVRELYELRRTGRAGVSARQMQAVVKSSMVMDREEHSDLMEQLLAAVRRDVPTAPQGVRLHLSGHFCQAPKPELLDAIESCGATVVGDDLFHGWRYISTDVREDVDPLDALAEWYMARNTGVPCPTRVQNNVDWDGFLLNAMEHEKAQGMVVLMAKFCEPHMYYYPEIKRAFERNGIPHLLIETEHEGIPIEGLRTRVETFLEIIRYRELA
ncbi:2-hydroxyacyl-CoA dehydratase subunit D [Hydrogenophaga sp.]|uniref:2-hydroxyacyl-CoA dehydratase subunit D n=1 Tax=Hydrogenophaga sp. TaxID=1904254 RepID=UPI0027257038|nr:2-hydroxyacyl-CoA dehydratase family protein [Hydrogenophaga sp.]MDO9439083.1 2-hydroxyacyl-CoA dehydratase family protein [Hydrogenophaga sp.]